MMSCAMPKELLDDEERKLQIPLESQHLGRAAVVMAHEIPDERVVLFLPFEPLARGCPCGLHDTNVGGAAHRNEAGLHINQTHKSLPKDWDFPVFATLQHVAHGLFERHF